MSSNKKVVSNLIWRFFERSGAQAVTIIVQIILARILDTSVYGNIALVIVFTTIMQVFVDSGLGNALIQKKNADNVDFSTVFYFNLVVCCVLYVLMYFAAPIIAGFYNNDELTPVIRVLSLILIISGIKNVEQAYVSKTMQFKRFFFATLGGTIGAAIIGIALAIAGYGVWALVAQYLFNATMDTIILWITVKWRPIKTFSFSRLKILFSYGWKLLLSSLINQIDVELRQLVIGKIYNSNDLAQYNRGRSFPDYVIININSSIDSVLLPSLSEEQDNVSNVRAMTRRAIKVSTYVIAPMMIGLISIGKPLIHLLLTDKWLPSYPYMCIFCISYIFYPIHTANLNAIKALGRSDMYLTLEILKKSIALIILLLSARISVMALAMSLLLTSLINQIINSWPNRKLLGYKYSEQMKDILPNIFIALLMGIIIYPISLLDFSSILIILAQITLGVAIYIFFSKVFKMDSYIYILEFIRQFKKHNKENSK